MTPGDLVKTTQRLRMYVNINTYSEPIVGLTIPFNETLMVLDVSYSVFAGRDTCVLKLLSGFGIVYHECWTSELRMLQCLS